ncbi:hypothetical protein [Nitrobacter vulgaris]|uniref:Uncharacterized protein n=1 Tax=Nitrobacter vulgaris TaxID=29421 RepID=A0A1V4HWP5_NITVU|nr:hypothetical protein [Nitrobacter vulgaris]OPH82386.1 hypothetical protein B2M20_12420 [Nitrobacter vulgaris]
MSRKTERTELHDRACPLAAIDRRLEDVHRHWHSAERAYFEPDGFRIAIQTAIQTLRTVTFVLQSNKHLIPEFDRWYAPWQEKLKSDGLMRWMVDARNKIEKQGDLEANSFVRAEIIASYLNNGPVIEVPAKLFDGPQVLIKSIPESALGQHIKEFGTVKIQRRWVENSLPDYELLDAVAMAYGKIAEVVHDAHRNIGRHPPITIDVETGEEFGAGRAGRLPCMIGHGDARSINISLSDGKEFDLSREAIHFDRQKAEESVARYGLQPEAVFDTSGDQETLLDSLFDTARKMVEKDGYHLTLVFLLRGVKMVQVIHPEFSDHGAKYLIMRDIAHEVTRLAADGVILIGEAWRAVADPSKPYMRAADAPDRKEVLRAILVRREGDPVELFADFHRNGDQVTLGATQTIIRGQHFMFAPIYDAWAREIPNDWQD